MKRLYLTPLLIVVGLLTACASINPFAAAKGPDEQAYSLLGAYDVAQELLLKVVRDTTLPAEIRRTASQVDSTTVPVLKGVRDAALLYVDAKVALEAGIGSQEKVAIAMANLKDWVARGRDAMATVRDALRNANRAKRKVERAASPNPTYLLRSA